MCVKWTNSIAGVYLVLVVSALHEVVVDGQPAMCALGASYKGWFVWGVVICHRVIKIGLSNGLSKKPPRASVRAKLEKNLLLNELEENIASLG